MAQPNNPQIRPLFTDSDTPPSDAQVVDWASTSAWTRVNSFAMGHRTFEIPKRRKMQRAYGRAAAATIVTGRRVIGR